MQGSKITEESWCSTRAQPQHRGSTAITCASVSESGSCAIYIDPMHREDDWGPWNDQIPILQHIFNAKNNKKALKTPQNRRNSMEMKGEKGQKTTFPAKSISLFESFNRSFDTPQSRKRPVFQAIQWENHRLTHRKPSIERKWGGRKTGFVRGKTGSGTGIVTLAMGSAGRMGREGQEVLAGMWEDRIRETNQRLLEAIEGQIGLKSLKNEGKGGSG